MSATHEPLKILVRTCYGGAASLTTKSLKNFHKAHAKYMTPINQQYMTSSLNSIYLTLLALLLTTLPVNACIADGDTELTVQREDYALYSEIAADEFNAFSRKINAIWGKPSLSNSTKWIDYSDDLKKRLIIDFENETLHFERVDSIAIAPHELHHPLMAILNLTTTQAFERDTLAQAIEKRLMSTFTDIMTAEVDDNSMATSLFTEREKLTVQEKELLVQRMIDEREFQLRKSTTGSDIAVVSVQLSTIDSRERSDNLWPKASKIVRQYVEKFSTQEKVPEALLYSVIATESAFNPLATSAKPAFGLMQLSPSVGIDVTAKIFGQPKILAPSYFYNSQNNIEMAATYLNSIFNHDLKEIANKRSRIYCSIVVYHSSVGVLADALNTKDLSGIAEVINDIAEDEVYEQLLEHLATEKIKDNLRQLNKAIR